MLSTADIDVTQVIRELGEYGVSACYLVPTPVGLRKSIYDATQNIRDYFLRNGIHDFANQPQKEYVREKITILKAADVADSTISMYRPESKNGDPRLNIYSLPKHAQAGNLIAILGNSEIGLFAANLSDDSIRHSISTSGSPLNEVILKLSSHELNPNVRQLRTLLEGISAQGFLPSLKAGDTGVGFTLETHLGIAANSSKKPDFRGIEIKAGRVSNSNRSTLFSQVPDWRRSNVSSYKDLITKYGYVDLAKDRKALQVTISNLPYRIRDSETQIFLEVTQGESKLEMLERQDAPKKMVLLWEMEKLKERLQEKHPDTFWVEAKVDSFAGVEHFHYTKAVHTRAPFSENLPALLESGIVTFDLTGYVGITSGKSRDHGVLFKIHKRNFSSLFPPPKIYNFGAESRNPVSA